MTWTRTQDLPIQIQVCSYWAKLLGYIVVSLNKKTKLQFVFLYDTPYSLCVLSNDFFTAVRVQEILGMKNDLPISSFNDDIVK